MDEMMEKFRIALVYLKGKNKKSIAEISGAAMVSPRHIQAVLSEKERKGLGRGAQQRVAELFRTTPEKMLAMGDAIMGDQVPIPSNVTPAPPDRHQPRKIPLISWVQAGDWREVSDLFHPGDADQWVDTSSTDSQYAFALVVHGDSMEPEFRDGDVIVVDPELSPESGDYVIAKNGDDATFKQFVRDGSSVFLKPLNERYPIKDMTGVTKFRIVGIVREKKSRYR
jgi:SOS-response transcriptional repressor LexA